MEGKRVELLAPAGSWEAFLAAVENGADAVYLGGTNFSARQFAGNFNDDALEAALDHAHVRGVKIYLTVNTLLNDSELEQAADFAYNAYRMGIDGMIVQDLGFASVIRSLLPGLNLHASTQMTIYSLEGVRALERLGFKRVVLARELSLEEIGNITRNTPLEIEIFVHGALCISYSGQCLMSSIIGGRSGNRGKCAQPCRLGYRLVENGAVRRETGGRHLISPKDLCSIDLLDKIASSGVRSLKIEGRMKTPEYVAVVVGTYRKYLDRVLAGESGAVEEDDRKRLLQIFNRGGFTTGYLLGKTGHSMICGEKPKNWGIYLGTADGYDRSRAMVTLKLEESLGMGDGVEVWNRSEEHPGNIITEIRRKGKNVPEARPGDTVSIGSIEGEIKKGDKIYKTSDKKLNISARQSFEEQCRRKAVLQGRVEIRKGAPAALKIYDENGGSIYVKGEIPAESAINRPLTEERILEQLGKTGGTPFTFGNIEIVLEPGLSLPVSELNGMRRKALERMEALRIGSAKRDLPHAAVENRKQIFNFPGNGRYLKEEGTQEEKKLKLSAYFYKWDGSSELAGYKADRVYLPFELTFTGEGRRLLDRAKFGEYELFLWIPSVTRGIFDGLMSEKLKNYDFSGIDGFLAGNPGTLELLGCHAESSAGTRQGKCAVIGGREMKVMGDYTLNSYNSLTLREIYRLGLYGATLSPELTLAQISGMRTGGFGALEAIAYGRIPLMTSEYCPAGGVGTGGKNGKSCGGLCSRKEYRLKDRKGVEFPLLFSSPDCRSTILNSSVIFVPEILGRLKNTVESVRLYFSGEQPTEAAKIISLHREAAAAGPDASGSLDKLMRELNLEGCTKGHYFRGV